ncbi:MAG: insulinase family protein [Holosporaceae bacterium]|jgi:zinc protease|nr:insulinase family protein [Holosporaceae bacterium]
MVKLLSIICCFIIAFTINGKHDFSYFTLKNGLKVVCIKKRVIPIVAVSVWYNCGSKCDATGKSGVAHFLEHMAFHSNSMTFNNFLEEIGAENNASTSLGYICFYEIVPKESMEEILKYESARMRSLGIDSQVFTSEKKAILEERSIVYDANPIMSAKESVNANIFNGMPGGISIVGWKHEIESIQQQDLFDFHNKWFAPNNAVLLLVGDVDPHHVKPLVEKYFGGLKEKNLPTMRTQNNVHPSVIKTITHKFSEANCFITRYIYKVPFFAKDNFRKYISLSLAIQAMNQPEFFMAKVIKSATNSLNDIWFSYASGAAYDIVMVNLIGISRDEMDDMEKLWHCFKQKLLSDSILTNDEINAIKRQNFISMAYEDDDIMVTAQYVGSSLMAGHPLEKIMATDEIIQAITLQECNSTISEIFQREPIAVSRLEKQEHDNE